MIGVEETDVDLAKQAYKPAWAIEGGYGARGADRPDFASVGVSLTIPLFTGKRQDRALSAARKDKSAAISGNGSVGGFIGALDYGVII